MHPQTCHGSAPLQSLGPCLRPCCPSYAPSPTPACAKKSAKLLIRRKWHSLCMPSLPSNSLCTMRTRTSSSRRCSICIAVLAYLKAACVASGLPFWTSFSQSACSSAIIAGSVTGNSAILPTCKMKATSLGSDFWRSLGGNQFSERGNETSRVCTGDHRKYAQPACPAEVWAPIMKLRWVATSAR